MHLVTRRRVLTEMIAARELPKSRSRAGKLGLACFTLVSEVDIIGRKRPTSCVEPGGGVHLGWVGTRVEKLKMRHPRALHMTLYRKPGEPPCLGRHFGGVPG